MFNLYVRPLSLAKQRYLHLCGTPLTEDHEQNSNQHSIAELCVVLAGNLEGFNF